MKRHHLRTLQALYAHPLQHGVRVAKVEALFRSLGATVTELGDRRLRPQVRKPGSIPAVACGSPILMRKR